MTLRDVAMSGVNDQHVEVDLRLGQVVPMNVCGNLITAMTLDSQPPYQGHPVLLSLPQSRYAELSALRTGQRLRVRGYVSNYFAEGCDFYYKDARRNIWVDSFDKIDEEQEDQPQDAGRSVATGTCFVVAPSGRIVTADHVVKDRKTLSIKFSDGSTSTASIVASSEERDVAILATEEPQRNGLPLASASEIALGDRIFTIGFPTPDLLGWEPKFTDGSVSALSAGGNGEFFQMSIPIQPGNSGGPVVDERGQVIGVVSAKMRDTSFENVGFAAKSESILSLLNEKASASSPLPGERSKVIQAVERATCRIAAE